MGIGSVNIPLTETLGLQGASETESISDVKVTHSRGEGGEMEESGGRMAYHI